MQVFLDSCIIIYLLEGADPFRQPVAAAIREQAEDIFCASDLVRLECRIGPLRANDEALLEEYDEFFGQVSSLPLGSDVFDLAAELRAQHGLRTPDAIHLATALIHGCDEFWTNDLRLTRATAEIRFRVLP